MRGLLVAIVGMFGLAAWWQRRRRRDADYTAPDELGPDPAEELRAKLAENRAADDEAEHEAEAEPPEPERSPLDPESRRQDVHERARASIDELG